ncbi:MAG: hypothetical protein ABI472_11820 [Ginsengibacter sp.]
MKSVQEVDPDLLDDNDYIQKRSDEEKSTIKKDYFKDIFLPDPDNIKHHLFETFPESIGQDRSEETEDIRTILS